MTFKVGCGLFGKIYAGNVNNKGMYTGNKHDVTDTAPQAVAQFLISKDISMEFTHSNGKKYVLKVEEIK